jgi:hypothetical protein
MFKTPEPPFPPAQHSSSRVGPITAEPTAPPTHNKNQQGHITEADLHAYAEAQGMPTAYVRPFFEALLARPAGGGSEPGSGSGEGAAGGGGGEGAAGGGGEEVGFRRFRSFVVAREQGLRDAFEMFDKGTRGPGARGRRGRHATAIRLLGRCPDRAARGGGCARARGAPLLHRPSLLRWRLP